MSKIQFGAMYHLTGGTADVWRQDFDALAAAVKAGVDGIDYYIYRAAPKNYAFKNCLANHPEAFKELASFVRGHAKGQT